MPHPRRSRIARVNVVILACAVSAGIHGALVPEHLEEGAAPGLAFAAATVLLAAVAVALTLRPESRVALAAAAFLLAGLIASYALAVTAGLPLVHPEQEPVETLALWTKAIEAAGLLGAVTLLRRSTTSLAPQPKGV